MKLFANLWFYSYLCIVIKKQSLRFRSETHYKLYI